MDDRTFFEHVLTCGGSPEEGGSSTQESLPFTAFRFERQKKVKIVARHVMTTKRGRTEEGGEEITQPEKH